MKKVILMLLAMASIGVYAELTPVKVKKLWGLQDENGTMVVAPTYTSIGEFSGQYTWVNKGGNCIYEQFPISGKWGVIDDEGNEVCPVEYEYVDLCYGGYVNVNRGGVINMDNRTISGGLWGIYDLVNKKEVVPCVYTQLGPVNSNGVCWAQKGGTSNRNLFVITDKDQKGNIVNLRYQFYYYNRFQMKDLFARHRDEGKWGIIAVDGQEISDFRFTKVNEFINGYAVVSIARKLGVIDSNGHQLIPCEYMDITHPLHWGVCWARKEGKYALININNQELTPYQYDAVRGFSEGKAWIRIGELFGLVDTAGIEIIKPTYQKVYPLYNGSAPVMGDDKIGLVNQDGVEVIPLIYAQTAPLFGENQFRPLNKYSSNSIQWFRKFDKTFDWYTHEGELLATDTKKEFNINDSIPSALWDY